MPRSSHVTFSADVIAIIIIIAFYSPPPTHRHMYTNPGRIPVNINRSFPHQWEYFLLESCLSNYLLRGQKCFLSIKHGCSRVLPLKLIQDRVRTNWHFARRSAFIGRRERKHFAPVVPSLWKGESSISLGLSHFTFSTHHLFLFSLRLIFSTPFLTCCVFHFQGNPRHFSHKIPRNE